MKLTRSYPRTRFDANVVAEAIREFSASGRDKSAIRTIRRGPDAWGFDSDEEFLAEWRAGFSGAHLNIHGGGKTMRVSAYEDSSMEVEIEAATRPDIEGLIAIFERSVEDARLPEPSAAEAPTPVIFIGHGRSDQWRDLRDHLQDKHYYRIEAYEIGERVGHTIRDILKSMLENASFAILIMTGEDEQATGEIRARQNVVHELGLFQGKLGFNRAIVLLEEGTEDFSNLQGIHQIRYGKGRIKETYGDVLAALRREFDRA